MLRSLVYRPRRLAMLIKRTTTNETAIAMASSAGLELFWSAVAVACALLGMLGTRPMTMSAIAAVATSFALLAQSGELAARWPTRGEMPSHEAVGFNLVAALGALLLASLAIAGVAEVWLLSIALMTLAGLLVLDAPLEPELAAPRGTIAGAVMVIAGLGAILVVTAALAAHAGVTRLVPWAALLIGAAHFVGASAVLLRFARATS
jgi:hypothetical protein